jgi:hypothetical protein
MELQNLIETHLDLDRLARDLDELGHEGRTWAVRSWGRGTQAKLYEAAKGFRPITLDHFVPPSTQPLTEVVHHGRNTLPMFRFFEKHICRPTESTEHRDKLWGHNLQSTSVFSGPGYFVVHPPAEEGGAEQGEVDIDYTMLPDEKPASWPPIVPSSTRLGVFIYSGMIDVMRGISSHVCIGRSKKKGRWIDNWFVLVRQDRANGAS